MPAGALSIAPAGIFFAFLASSGGHADGGTRRQRAAAQAMEEKRGAPEFPAKKLF
jgi:hypothetical protein